MISAKRVSSVAAERLVVRATNVAGRSVSRRTWNGMK